MRIFFNNSSINDWNFGDDNIIKVYRNGATVYYKVITSGSTPTYQVCYAVVDDISQYQETEYEDVFNKADGKWYKLNNLNQYEEYGVYGDSIAQSATTYQGKLATYDGYEYIYSGNSWQSVGAVSGSSRLPAGYTEVEYLENTSRSYLDTNFKPNQDTRIVADMQCVTSTAYGRYIGSGKYNSSNAMQFDYEQYYNGTLYISWGAVAGWKNYSSCVGDYARHVYDWDKNVFYRDKGETNEFSTSTAYTNFQCTNNLGIFTYINNGSPSTDYGNEYLRGRMYSFQIYDNGTLVRDLVPCKRTNDNLYGAYDIVNDVFYYTPNYSSYPMTGGSASTPVVYPLYYDEKADPLNYLTFSSMTEAQDYAYENCVYDGMIATIDGDRYYFDSDDENGWVKILSYYKVEDVSPDGVSGWTITGSSVYNPNSSYYDDFSVENSTTSYQTKIAKITVYGYENFTYYLRSTGYSTYAYAAATNVDEIQTNPSSYISYGAYSAITHTYNWNKTPGSEVNLSNYRRVTFNNLDKTVEHTFYVSFYGRTYSNRIPNATILIPKEQTNENWEQVTFTAPTTIRMNAKQLYIDDNYTISGGSQYWYERWIVGLPAGSHSSRCPYSSYDYCPVTTSSAFTSVAGETRQVDFTWEKQQDKSLQFRLVDTSGNTLTPSNTVYYSFTVQNACVIASASDTTFPGNKAVKPNGYMAFGNSSNRHYIYGYSPNIRLNVYAYHVNDYDTYFDIPYTKLDEEAVTVTYTTYDPNDAETPGFSTSITWPYNGGTTSSTTLTSYGVPYTYSYSVKQTNTAKFASTSAQTYTAGQASRTISFTLYPNNREFSTVADMEAYQYAWEGMKATVGDTRYIYKNGEWVENTYVVPSGYTELTYVQSTKQSTGDGKLLAVPNELQANYIYSFEFTPLNWNGNYYGQIIGGQDGVAQFKKFGIFKLDNGWGDETKRFVSAFWNYNLETRSSSPGGRYRVYTGVKSKFTMNLHDFSDATQGADIKVENEGYSAYTHTSTTTYGDVSSIETGVYDINIFSDGTGAYYMSQFQFHNFKVVDSQGNLIYDYRPVQRVSDDVVGLYDVVNQEFFYPTGFALTAGDPV